MVPVLVDDIPALIVGPSGSATGVALSLLGGNKEETEPALVRFAEARFYGGKP